MSEVRENAWDGDFLRTLPTLSLEAAQEQVCALIEEGSTKPSKKAGLIRDVRRAKTSAEVARIMYNAMLAGSGLGVTNSSWQKLHAGS